MEHLADKVEKLAKARRGGQHWREGLGPLETESNGREGWPSPASEGLASQACTCSSPQARILRQLPVTAIQPRQLLLPFSAQGLAYSSSFESSCIELKLHYSCVVTAPML